MKKLMIAAAIVCAAAFAQAGAIQWTALNLTSSGAPFTGDTKYTGYLFSGSDVATMTALLDAGNTADFEAAAVAHTTVAYNTAVSKMNLTGGNYGNFGEGESFQGFMIILDAATAGDATHYLVAENASGAQVLSQTFGKSGNKPFAYGDQTAQGNTTWAAIPEPTSGLLLLLGVAGLALKRRRA